MRIAGAEVARYRGGRTIERARGRYGGPNVPKMRRRWVNVKRIGMRMFAADSKASLGFFEVVDNVLEKKTRDVSSIGWNTMRATREPAFRQQYNSLPLVLDVYLP